MVGEEITDEAIELPSFRHPRQAAYILGAEREGLSRDVQSLCDYVVKIPTRFSVNLGVAGALVMYDRQLSLGRHAPRPVAEGAPTQAVELPVRHAAQAGRPGAWGPRRARDGHRGPAGLKPRPWPRDGF